MHKILSPYQTLEYINNGYSISRFGDGEFYMLFGNRGIRTQVYNRELKNKLSSIIKYEKPLKKHLVCIPDFFDFSKREIPYKPSNFKIKRWAHIAKKYAPRIPETTNIYGTSFVFRPEIYDISYTEYYTIIHRVLRERKLILVGQTEGPMGSFLDDGGLKFETEIRTPIKNSYGQYKQILRECGRLGKALKGNKLFLLIIGPTATALAYDLHKAGFHAIDSGHIFGIYRRYKKGNM